MSIGTEQLKRTASTRIPTKWGLFKAIGYVHDGANGSANGSAALVMTLGDPTTAAAPLLRIHAQCVTGEILGSLRCDCGEQLSVAMQAIAAEGCGVVIYEYQEGRGIGLTAKLRAYELQDQGLDTIDANHALGFETDYRDYALPVAILRDLGIERVRLLSNNPDKPRVLRDAGIGIVAQVPCEAAPNAHSLGYLKTKAHRQGHTLTLRRANAFATVEEAIRETREGRMVVVVDDEHRENEGDLTMAAEMVTSEAVNFMATHGKGLICLAMTGDRLDELRLGPMVRNGGALGGTAFTVSIDARGEGMTTGIAASERARTIKAAVDAKSKADDFARPGHIFPLRAREGGVLERRGHTEAAVDLATLAGFAPAGVICEIVNDDGTMARGPDLVRFCEKHGLIMITVDALVRHQRRSEYKSDQFAPARRRKHLAESVGVRP
jgi:3,4-dihydroxy-2-butanone 4-phosphate synthase/GTP cyclohydrolase II